MQAEYAGAIRMRQAMGADAIEAGLADSLRIGRQGVPAQLRGGEVGPPGLTPNHGW